LLYRFEYAAKLLRQVEAHKLWQDGSHAMECYTSEFTRQKLQYIHQNPVQDLIVSEPEHYLFSSASAYAGVPGMLDVMFIDR
jgi:hypothetical protein